MKRIITLAMSVGLALQVTSTDYYLSTTGSDQNSGKSREQAFATLAAAQRVVKAGDNVYILPGKYTITEDQISKTENPYKVIFDMKEKGSEGNPISYIGLTENGQRPVFDLSQVNPTGYRITGFLISGQYLLLRNFEVTGIQVNITDHTQSENIRVTDGSYCTFDNIACHDGMGIGFYLTRRSHHNLFVNCDGYNNYDPVSESGIGGNNDGFGCHVLEAGVGNIFIGCRAWNNSDDGFDLINCFAPVTFCYSIAYKNGYDADGNRRQDGNGFKAGGYGMSGDKTMPEAGAPMHEVHHCISTYNKSNGIYSNHHLGGIRFTDNSTYKNGRYEYCFVNRRGPAADDAVDVNGYGHVVERNLAVSSSGKYVEYLNGLDGQNTITGNSFTWQDSQWLNADPTSDAFEHTTVQHLTLARNADGSLPTKTRNFMKQHTALGYGQSWDGFDNALKECKRIAGAEKQEEEPTAIRTVSHAAETTACTVYDLQGRAIGNGMTKRGLYIMNGRKYLAK